MFVFSNIVSFVLLCLICRRLPRVSVEESPKEAKPSQSLDLSDTDTECDGTASVSMPVKLDIFIKSYSIVCFVVLHP